MGAVHTGQGWANGRSGVFDLTSFKRRAILPGRMIARRQATRIYHHKAKGTRRDIGYTPFMVEELTKGLS